MGLGDENRAMEADYEFFFGKPTLTKEELKKENDRLQAENARLRKALGEEERKNRETIEGLSLNEGLMSEDIMYSRKTIVEALSGILDCVNHGSVAVYDTPHDKSYFDGYRDAIKDLLVNFGETQFETEKKESQGTITVKEIIAKWLTVNGYDGLHGDECGCDLSDLMPCGEFGSECEAGYKMPCDCGDHNFHIGNVKTETPKVDPQRS